MENEVEKRVGVPEECEGWVCVWEMQGYIIGFDELGAEVKGQDKVGIERL